MPLITIVTKCLELVGALVFATLGIYLTFRIRHEARKFDEQAKQWDAVQADVERARQRLLMFTDEKPARDDGSKIH